MSVRTILTTLALGVVALSPPAMASPSAEAIVRQDAAALTSGNVDDLVALFSEDAKVFRVPGDPRKLVGELSPGMSGREAMRSTLASSQARRSPDRYEIAGMTSIGDLVIAQMKITEAPAYVKSRYSLAAFRVSDGLIQDLWHIARADDVSALRNPQAVDTIARLVDANNRGDVESFLALFAEDARNYPRAKEPFRLSDVASSKVVDHRSRGETFRAMFAKGAPVQVKPIRTLVFGDLVIAREEAVKPDGAVLDELSIYRVRDGKILDDWFVAAIDR